MAVQEICVSGRYSEATLWAAVLAGKYRDQFLVDWYQGGAGTSTNMNANEVIANRALELLGRQKGDYKFLIRTSTST